MKFLSSGVSFIIEAILVIAGVLVFAYFDPFGIFVSNKLTLKDTPAHIREIRSIGELVTAEYYGEVISSYQSIVYIQKEEEITRTKSKLAEMDSLFIDRLVELSSIEDKKQRKAKFDSTLDSFKQRDNFDDYLKSVKKQLNLNFLNSLFNQLLATENINKLRSNKDYLSKLKSEQEKEIIKVYSKRAIRKPQLILIGRGKVQAGFRFGNLSSRNMRIDSLHKRIILFGLQPEILSCDINPWLIPELGIKGFEIVEVNGKADNPAILYKVKKSCLDSLRANALASDILNIAKANAEQNLQTFFSLLLNDKAVDVKIESDLISYWMKNLGRDSIITPSDLEDITRNINSCLNPGAHNTTSAYDSLRAFSLLDTLKLCRIVTGKDTTQVSPFILPVYQLLMNSRINSKNKDSIANVLKTRKNSIQKNRDLYARWFYQPSVKAYAIKQPDSTDPVYRSWVQQSDRFFELTFGRVYPDSVKSPRAH
jgi:hypothetical protein